MKSKLKLYLGRHYDHLIRIRRSRPIQITAGLSHTPVSLLRQRRNGRYLPIDIVARMGLGGALNHVLNLAAFAEARGLTPVVRMSNPLYAVPGGDAFGACFEHVSGEARAALGLSLAYHEIHHEASYLAFRAPDFESIEQASALFFRHFRVRPELERAVAGLQADEGLGRIPLAIHFRGTDKRLEADLPELPVFKRAVAEVLRGSTMDAVFLATDVPAFREALVREFPRVRFVSYELGEARVGEPRHFHRVDPGANAREAMVNMLMIARAERCIRTPSFMSSWAKLLNPALPVFTLGRPHQARCFPESLVWARRHEFPGAISLEGREDAYLAAT